MPDPVLAFQSLLALYRRDDVTPNRRKNAPKRITQTNYNPTPCDTKPEGWCICTACHVLFIWSAL